MHIESAVKSKEQLLFKTLLILLDFKNSGGEKSREVKTEAQEADTEAKCLM